MQHLLQRSREAVGMVWSFLQAGWLQTRLLLAGMRVLLADLVQTATRRREQQAVYPVEQ